MKMKQKFAMPLLLLFAGITIVSFLLLRKIEPFEEYKQSITSLPCPIGSWCPSDKDGSKVFPCEAGRYGNTRSNISPECSGPCDPGCVCERGSTTSCPTFCPKGYYCPKGTGGKNPPKICPDGFYCPERSANPTPCPEGRQCLPGTDAI